MFYQTLKYSHFIFFLANVLLDLVLVSMCKKCSYNVNLSLCLSFDEVSKKSHHSSVVFLCLQTQTCVWGSLWFLLGKNIQQDKLGILRLE